MRRSRKLDASRGPKCLRLVSKYFSKHHHAMPLGHILIRQFNAVIVPKIAVLANVKEVSRH